MNLYRHLLLRQSLVEFFFLFVCFLSSYLKEDPTTLSQFVTWKYSRWNSRCKHEPQPKIKGVRDCEERSLT